MLGSFLELSVWARDIAGSVAFWEALGLEHAQVGETWSHRYGVLTDGRLFVGLHDYEFDSPSVTFVRPDIADAVAGLRSVGVTLDFAKTGDSQFNEAGFRDLEIALTSGFSKPEKVRAFVEAEERYGMQLFSFLGAGFADGRYTATSDIVGYYRGETFTELHKVGRPMRENPRLEEVDLSTYV